MHVTSDFAPEQLESCLQQLLAPDTSLIKQAEGILKGYLKHVQCIGGLMVQIQHSTHCQVRQMAAILLRKRINTHWSKLDAQTQKSIKTSLLNCSIQEPERLVRTSLALLVSNVAKHQLPAGQWPELLGFINECTKSPHEAGRELAMNFFYCLTDTVGEHLEPHFPEIKTMFGTALLDAQSIKVRVMAMKAACSLLQYLSAGDEALQFQELIPSMIEVLKVCLANGDETEAMEFLDIFGDLAESPLPVLSPSLTPLVHALLQTMLNQDLEGSTRDGASFVMTKLLEGKPKTVAKSGLVKDILSVAMRMIAQDDTSAGGMHSSQFNDESDDDDDDECDDSSPTKIAQRILDVMALNLGAKYFDTTMFELTSECMHTSDLSMRKAGTVALGVVAEGCAERLRPRMAEILPFLYQSAQDSHPLLREAACFALGQWSEHLQPDILDHYEQLIPIVFQLLDDATPSVKGTSCYVLESLTENMEAEAILPYLEPLMEKLVSLVLTSKPQIQLMAISAIGSTAVGAEEAFEPYFLPTAQMLQPFLQLTDEKFMSLRGRSIECMGYLAIAVGPEVFQPCFAQAMEYAIAAAEVQDMELCDYVFAFFSNVSKAFEQDFAPYLERVVPLIAGAIQMEDGMQVKVRGGQESSSMANFDDSDDEEDGGGGEGSRGAVISVRTAMLEMKSGAVSAIESIAEHTGPHFEPYIPVCMTILSDMMSYFHADVRAGVISSICQMVIVSVEARPMTSAWVQGKPRAVEIDPLTQKLLSAVMEAVDMFLADEDPTVVEKTLDGLVKISEKVGPVATFSRLDAILRCALEILKEDHVSQFTAEEEDSEEDEEVSLLASTCDMIVVLAKCYGAELHEGFKQLIPALMVYTKGVRPSADRASVFGCLAEVSRELGSSIAAYANDFVAVALLGLTDEADTVRQNCAYCLGIFAQVNGPGLNAHYPALLQGLRPLFDEDDDSAAVRDNAAAAVARMMMANPSGVPLDQVLPIFLNALPLQVDETEVEVVFECLLGMIEQQNPLVFQHMGLVLKIFANALNDEESIVDEDVQQKIEACLRWLMDNFATQLRPLLQGLPAEDAKILHNRLNNAS